MIKHLNSKEVTHLLVCREDVLQECDVPYHIFESHAILISVHDDRKAPLIFTAKFDTAVFDLVVIGHKRAHLSRVKHTKRQSEEVLSSALSNELKLSIICNVLLLLVRFENDLEVCDDHGTF